MNRKELVRFESRKVTVKPERTYSTEVTTEKIRGLDLIKILVKKITERGDGYTSRSSCSSGDLTP